MFILNAKYFGPQRTEYSYIFCTKLDAHAVLLCRQPLGFGTHHSSFHTFTKSLWDCHHLYLEEESYNEFRGFVYKSCRDALEGFERFVSRVALVIAVIASIVLLIWSTVIPRP